MDSTSPSLPLGVVPSMMEMCTALGRVLGTLVERGPWVMDGQLLLGTMPALRDTHRRRSQWKPSPNTLSATVTFDKKKRRNLCISGGSLLILALCSITSFATFPLRKQVDKNVNVTYWTHPSSPCKQLWCRPYLYLKRLPLKKRLLLDTVRT